jgi:CTP:molybdopterin cytidylyltransferase MocA
VTEAKPPFSLNRIGGIVLAAGYGTRFGGPKALARMPDGEPWLLRAVKSLLAGGCHEVVVVLGVAAGEAASLLDSVDAVKVTRSLDVGAGLSESLRAGFGAAANSSPRWGAAAIVPVDVPDLSPETVARMISSTDSNALRQAFFGGTPGHPVVLGRSHWDAFVGSLTGDTGGRQFLVTNAAVSIDCSDLGTGQDVDYPLTANTCRHSESPCGATTHRNGLA